MYCCVSMAATVTRTPHRNVVGKLFLFLIVGSPALHCIYTCYYFQRYAQFKTVHHRIIPNSTDFFVEMKVALQGFDTYRSRT